jgi:hypothetical protein
MAARVLPSETTTIEFTCIPVLRRSTLTRATSLGNEFGGDMTETFKPQAVYNWPLSGAVSVPITINLGGSGNPAQEQGMLDHVGSYGRQIGWLCDALEVVIKKVDGGTLTKADEKALKTFELMAAAVRFQKTLSK